MQYFLGQEDRNMKNGLYGIGYYIYINNKFYEVKDVQDCIISTTTNEDFVLDNEPSFELFMKIMGEPWDTRYKAQWTGDEDYTDYVPLYYKTLKDFKNRGTLGAGTFYNK